MTILRNKFVGIAVATLVLLEVVLQVGSLWVWWTHQTPADVSVDAEADVVLCIGDSFTYGMGASSPAGSYPSQLEAMLRASHGDTWRVANVGYPGRDSRGFVERIDGQLAQYRPRFVCILAGNNDLWSRPEQLVLPPVATAPADPPAQTEREPFRWEWRTARFVRWATGKLESSTPDDEEMPAVVDATEIADFLCRSTWSGGSVSIEFRRDGSVEVVGFGSSPRPLATWDYAQGTNTIDAIPALAGTNVGEQLLFTHEVLVDPIVLDRRPAAPIPTTQALFVGRQAIQDFAFERARDLLTDALEREQQESSSSRSLEVQIHGALVAAYDGTGEREQAREHVDWLRAELAERPSAAVAVQLVKSLGRIGARTECIELARQLVKTYPNEASLWSILSWESFQAGDQESAVHGARKAIELTPLDKPSSRGAYLRTLVRIIKDSDPRGAAIATLQSYLEFRDPVVFRQTVGWMRDIADVALFEDCLSELRIEDPLRQEMLDICADGLELEKAEGPPRVFESHIRQIVERCQHAGAEPILVSYLRVRPRFDPVIRRISESGVAYVDLHGEFRRARTEGTAEELFVSDGHCSDLGYRLIAEKVHAHISGRLAVEAK